MTRAQAFGLILGLAMIWGGAAQQWGTHVSTFATGIALLVITLALTITDEPG